MFCKMCGSEVNDHQAVCLNCGCLVNETTIYPLSQTNNDDYYRKLSEYEKISGIVWLVIGIIQICTLIGVICGIWNIIAAISRMKYANELLQKPSGIVENFENNLTQIIIVMIINVFFGALIGVVGSIVDLFVRNYVIENKKMFN